jgi:hypothetical protein
LNWRPPRATQIVDRRVVANPVQARSLTRAVGEDSEAGARLVAYFACIYGPLLLIGGSHLGQDRASPNRRGDGDHRDSCRDQP